MNLEIQREKYLEYKTQYYKLENTLLVSMIRVDCGIPAFKPFITHYVVKHQRFGETISALIV
jgi:hypothetical protein